MTAGAAAVEVLAAGGLPGRAAGAWHVPGPGAAAGAATARLAALIDPAFLAEAGWDCATRVLSPPAEHPLLRWRGDRRRGGVLAPAAAGGDLCGVVACPRERGNRRYCRAHYERLLRLRRADPSFNERA